MSLIFIALFYESILTTKYTVHVHKGAWASLSLWPATIRMLSCTLDIPCPYTEILCLLSSPSLLPLLPPSSLPCFTDSRVVILLSILWHLHYHISNCDDLPDKFLNALGSILMLLHDQDVVSRFLLCLNPGSIVLQTGVDRIVIS